MTVASKVIFYLIFYVDFIFVQTKYAYPDLHPSLESELNRETRKAECCAKKMRCCKKRPPPPTVEIRAVIARCIDPPNVCYRDRNIKRPLNKGNAHNLQHFIGFDEDEPLVQSQVTKCAKKLILTIKIKNFGETNTRNQYIVVDHVYDPLSDTSVRLLNPYVVKMKQEQISQAYMIKFIDFVNSQAREHVYNKHDGNYTGCCMNEKHPTCGLVTFKGKPIKYSSGFCCSCDAQKNAERQPHSEAETMIGYSDPAYLLDSVQCPRTQLDVAKAERKKAKKKQKIMEKKLKEMRKEKLLGKKILKDNQKRHMDTDDVYYIKPQGKYSGGKTMQFGDVSRKEFGNEVKFSTVKNLDDELSTEMNLMIDSLQKEYDDNDAGRKLAQVKQEKLYKDQNFVKTNDDFLSDDSASKPSQSERKLKNKPSLHAMLNADKYDSDGNYDFKDNIQKIADKAFHDAYKSLGATDQEKKYLEKQVGPSPEDLEFDLPENMYKKRQVQSSGIQRRGGQNCADRYTPPNLDPESYHESTHCLRFSPVWYGVYKLGPPVVEQQILFQIFEKYETYNGAFKWRDLTNGEKVKMGTFWPHYKDKTPSVSMTFSAIFDDANFCLDWKRMRLLVPEGLKVDDLIKYPEARGGPPEFLMVPSEKIVMNGDQCDVAGVGFAAFYKQPNRCSMPRGSCLHHQPYHLWHYDKDLQRNGKKGCFFLKHYGKLAKNPLRHNASSGEKFLSLNYYGHYESVIDMEVNADSNAVLRPTSTAVITEVYIDSTCPSSTTITIKVSNSGLLSSKFLVRICDCPLEVQDSLKEISSDLVTVPPQNQHIFHLVVHAALHMDIFFCSAEVLNKAGELVALRRIKIQKLDRCICTWHCLCACIGSATGLKCIPMKIDHYHAAGFKGGLPIISKIEHVTLTGDILHLIVFILLFVVFLLFALGLTKALVGLCCTSTGMWGLNVLLDLPKPMTKYYDKDLMDRPVQYDAEGWPIHPDTGKKMRNIPATTEFCVNITFFFTYPTIMFLMLLKRICHPFHKYRKKKRAPPRNVKTWIKSRSCDLKSCMHKHKSQGDLGESADDQKPKAQKEGKKSSRKRKEAPPREEKGDEVVGEPSTEKDVGRKSKASLNEEKKSKEKTKPKDSKVKLPVESSENLYYYTSTDENVENTSVSGASGKKSDKAKGSKS